MSALPVEQAYRLPARRGATLARHRSVVGRPSASSAASRSAASPSSPWTRPSRSPPARRACVGSLSPRPGRVLLYAAEDALQSCAAAWRASAPPPASVFVTSTFTSSPRQRCGSIFPRTAAASSRPSRNSRHVYWSWIRSSVYTGSTRTPAARSRRSSPIFENCSDVIVSPSCSCIMPKKRRPPARRSGAARIVRVPCLGRLEPLSAPYGAKLKLTVEHRAAPSTPAIELELVSRNEALALEVLTSAPCESPASTSIDERITAALLDASQPLSISELRLLCRVRNATLYERLTAMTAAGRLHRGADGYRIAAES